MIPDRARRVRCAHRAAHVLTQPVALSAEQIEAMASLIPNTNRPVQPLNERTLVVDAP